MRYITLVIVLQIAWLENSRPREASRWHGSNHALQFAVGSIVVR